MPGPQQGAGFLRVTGHRKWSTFTMRKTRLPLWEGGRQRKRFFVIEPSFGVGKSYITVPILDELPDSPTLPPDVENPYCHFLCSPGAKISIEQPSVCRTCKTFPICAVGLPASRSTINRRPTPETPASSSCRKFCSLRVLRTKAPMSAGLLTCFAILFPDRENNRKICAVSTKFSRSGKYFEFSRKRRQKIPIGKIKIYKSIQPHAIRITWLNRILRSSAICGLPASRFGASGAAS